MKHVTGLQGALGRFVLVVPFVLLCAVAPAQDPAWNDAELIELSRTARERTAAGLAEEAIEAWEVFVAAVDHRHAQGIGYGEPFEVLRFHANLEIAVMLDEATGRLEVELAGLDPVKAGRIVIGEQIRTESFVRAYLEQFRWAPTDIPERVAEDPNDELGAIYMLGALLVNRGQWYEVVGDLEAAERDWKEARDQLVDAIERVLGVPFNDGSAAAIPPEFRYLTMLVERYLETVVRVDGADAYVERVRTALGWLPRNDHTMIIHMRRQAAEWAGSGSNLDQAATLCGLVRDVHRDWFQGEFAHLMDNVWAHVVDIAIAIDQDDLAKAEELLAVLEDIPGLEPFEIGMVEDLRNRLDSEFDVARLLEEVFQFVDAQRRGERPPFSTGVGLAGLEDPLPPLAQFPSPVETVARPVADPRPATAGLAGNPVRPARANVTLWILITAASGVALIALLMVRRRFR